MILADTNVLIEYFRARTSALAQKIDALPIAICGVVKAEVLHGARNDTEFDGMIQAFRTFENLITDEYDWEFTGLLLRTLRTNGIQVPLADALIAYSALKYDVPLWTHDTHFELIKRIYPELELYNEE